jgi:hypothetical protein
LVASGIETGTSGSVARNSDRLTIEAAHAEITVKNNKYTLSVGHSYALMFHLALNTCLNLKHGIFNALKYKRKSMDMRKSDKRK